MQYDSWQTECTQESVAKIPHLAVLFSVLLCALKMPFCSLSSGHSSVCQITDLFVQACPRQSAMEQGWQVLSHCFMITEGHLALRNLLLWKQKEQFCALHLLLTPLYHTEPQRWGKKHRNSISSGSWLDRKEKDKENWWHLPLQGRQNFTHWFCFFGSKDRNESEEEQRKAADQGFFTR